MQTVCLSYSSFCANVKVFSAPSDHFFTENGAEDIYPPAEKQNAIDKIPVFVYSILSYQ